MVLREFLDKLGAALDALDEQERNKHLSYYAEMIQDRVEDGMTEAEAIEALGDVDTIASEILSQQPIPKLVKQRITKEKRRFGGAGVIILLILGFPLWFPLLTAFCAVLLSVYIVVWSVIICLFACVLSIGLSAVACLAGTVYAMFHNPLTALSAFSAALVLAGFAVLAFFPAKYAAVGLVKLTAQMGRGVKRLIIGKERV